VQFYKVRFTKIGVFYKTKLTNPVFCDYFTLFYHKSSFSLFAYCICVALNTSVKYDTILLPRCHFELLDATHFTKDDFLNMLDEAEKGPSKRFESIDKLDEYISNL
jgi:hypothetical protein